MCGVLVLVLGVRMFRDGKGSDAMPQSVAGASLVVAAAALPFAAAGTSFTLPSLGAGQVVLGGALLLFAAANTVLSLRLVLLERRRDGIAFLVAGLAAALFGLLLLFQLTGA